MRAIARRAGLALAIAGLAAPALATGPEGAWLDRFGRYTMLQLGGSQPTPLQPGTRDLGDVVALFKDACLARPFGIDEPRAAVEARHWNFERLDQTVPAGATPADLSGWQAADVSVRSSKGVFFAPNPQCNVTAAFAASLDADAVEGAVTAALASPPANADKKLDKKGERRRGYEPVWTVPGPAGTQRSVYVHLMSNGGQTRLHLGAMEPKEKK
ncbi:MAG: hypothetical protein JO276_04760 [Sphingomonadaceae bacterium]|nr:hypothetical protein [Sphingomonadaceae bacterium]